MVRVTTTFYRKSSTDEGNFHKDDDITIGDEYDEFIESWSVNGGIGRRIAQLPTGKRFVVVEYGDSEVQLKELEP